MRDRVLELRALDRSVEEIAAELSTAGTPVSAQTVWTILHAEGIERLPRRTGSQRGAPPRLAAIKARALADWPAATTIHCDHAGLFLLFRGRLERLLTSAWATFQASRRDSVSLNCRASRMELRSVHA